LRALFITEAIADVPTFAEKRSSDPVADDAMDRYSGGEAAAFSVLYDRLSPRIRGWVSRQTRDRHQIEDLVQQTMLQVHLARAVFVPGSHVSPWVFAIARRLASNAARGSRRMARVIEGRDHDAPSSDAAADEVASARELADRTERALAALPEPQRTAFELLRIEGLTPHEAAEVLGTTVGAVKQRAHRALEALRATMGEHR